MRDRHPRRETLAGAPAAATGARGRAQRSAWRAADGEGPNGLVSFEPLGEDTTLVTVEMSYEPEGMKEQLGATGGLACRQVKEGRSRFKEVVETMGSETGAWRGELQAGERQI